MTSGDFLKIKRKEKKLTLRQMAYKTNLSHTYISEIEKGKLKGTPETQEKIFLALELNDDERKYFINLFEEEQLPEKIKNEITDLKKEIEELKHHLQECENNLVIHHNHNTGNQILGTNLKDVNIHTSAGITSEDLDISELSEDKLQDLKKFIKFLKNS